MKDERDGEEPGENTASLRATSPSARSKSPESESMSPPTSPREGFTSPLEGEISPATQSTEPGKRDVPTERPITPEPSSRKERAISPPSEEDLSQPEETQKDEKSTTYGDVEDSLAALDAFADSIGQDVNEPTQEPKPEVKNLCTYENFNVDFVSFHYFTPLQIL